MDKRTSICARRTRLAPAPLTMAPWDMSDPSASERAYQRLKSELLSGALRAGPLDIRRLGDRFRMSATPVREALARLHAEHLIRQTPYHGYILVRPSARTLEELYDLSRSLIDLCLARISMSGGRVSPAKRSKTVERPYADALNDLLREIAAGQSSLVLAEHIEALGERLAPARCIEPGIFPSAVKDVSALQKDWASGDLVALRRSLESFHRTRIARVDTIVRAMAENDGEPA